MSQGKGTSHLDRLLALIDIFTEERPTWTAEEILQVMPISRATLYRHLQRLCAAGLLASAESNHYRLGPRIIELDRQMRAGDPLLIHGRTVLAEMIGKVQGVILLCSHYGDRVLCIHQESADATIHSSMERGRPFNLFRGAPSRVILANLPVHRQRRLLELYCPQIAAAGLGSTWADFRKKLKEIRDAGVYVAHGEIDPELVGIGAPVLTASGTVLGSVAIVIRKGQYLPADLESFKQAARDAAATIENRLTD